MLDWGRCLLVVKMLTGNKRASVCLRPFLLGAIGVWAVVLSGCRKDEGVVSQPPSVVRPANPLTAARVSRDELAARLHAILEAAQDRLPQADEAALKAELEKNPEWVRLKREFDETTKKIDGLRSAKGGAAGRNEGKISK